MFYLNLGKSSSIILFKTIRNVKETFYVYSVHGLIHIADEVEYFKKSFQAISAFVFENYL